MLPYTLKAFPIVQIAPEIGPQKPDAWPPPIHRDVAQWRAGLEPLGNRGNQVYLHVPFCPFLCHFCPLFKEKSHEERTAARRELFVQAIIREIELYASSPQVAGTVFNTVYFGGGTPTTLTPAQLGRMMQALRTHLNITPDAEITLEGMARHMLAPGYLAACIEHGFNRISFGVESLEPKLRKRIGRGDSISDYEATVKLARSLSPDLVVNAETMAAMPEQTLDSVTTDVKEMIRWGLDSADVFYYVMMPGTKLEQMVTAKKRAEPRYGADMLRIRERVRDLFTEAGYTPVTGEVFSKSDRDLFTHTSFGGGGHGLNTVLALGPSAFGTVQGSVYQNVCDTDAYMQQVATGLLPVQRSTALDLAGAKRRAWILSILRLEVPDALVESLRLRLRIKRWRRLGLLERQAGGHRLSAKGLLWYNQMQMDVLPLGYLIQAAGSMFGAVEQTKSGEAEVNTQGHELLEMIRSTGPLGVAAYKSFQAVRRLPFFDNRPVGFTGALKMETN